MKDYVRPEMELIALVAIETVASGDGEILDGSLGLEDSIFD